MNTTMRTANVLLPLSHVLFASAAFCSEVASAPVSEPAQANPIAAPSPTPAPAATPNAGAAAAQTEPTSAASSLGPSPYEPSNRPPQATKPPAAPVPPSKQDDGPPTLLGRGGDYAIGGFGGLGVMYTRFAGTNAVQVCGEGAVIIDHALTLGGGGCGITTPISAAKYGPWPQDPNQKMTFGYGGAIIRYHLFSNSAINLGVGALVGAGGLVIGIYNENADPGSDSFTNKRSEAVFVFEPQVGGYANMTRWLRLGVTGGYRITSSVHMQGLSAGDLSSPTLGGVLQIGWF